MLFLLVCPQITIQGGRGGGQNSDLQQNKKMSIAPKKQKLLRIVWTYMSFPDFQMQKSVLPGAGVSPGDLN